VPPYSLLRLATDAQIAKDASAITAARGNVTLPRDKLLMV
jgi:hypothetical protein